MNNFSHDIGIIGGDMRQVYMADLLTQEGYSVITYCLPSRARTACHIASSLNEAVSSSRILAAPIPLTKNQVDIPCKQTADDMTIKALKRILTKQHLLFAGCIPNNLTEYFNNHGIYVYDYMQNKELTIYNSIATAEGAIALAISRSTINLHKSQCLITGYGACARMLAGYLSGMYADVTVCARDKSARAYSEACGFHAIDFGQLGMNIGNYDYIFNTVPAVVLTKDLLKKIKENAVIIDIASAPGGLDYAYAKEAKQNAFFSPGLPGIYAPEDSAKALVALLKSKIQECERLCH